MATPFKGRSRGRGHGYSKNYQKEFPTLGESSYSDTHSKKTAKKVLDGGPQFIKKAVVESLLTLATKDIALNQKDALFFKERYMSTQHYMVTEGKLRFYYETILTETNSVQIVTPPNPP